LKLQPQKAWAEQTAADTPCCEMQGCAAWRVLHYVKHNLVVASCDGKRRGPQLLLCCKQHLVSWWSHSVTVAPQLL
jgi:hypothetical protein